MSVGDRVDLRRSTGCMGAVPLVSRSKTPTPATPAFGGSESESEPVKPKQKSPMLEKLPGMGKKKKSSSDLQCGCPGNKPCSYDVCPSLAPWLF